MMDFRCNYQLVRSKKRRKTLALHIKEDGRILVYVPYRTPKSEIERFVEQRQAWILKRLLETEESAGPAEKGFQAGEKILYLGEYYPLDIADSPPQESPLKLSFGKFVLSENHVDQAKELFIRWYKKEAEVKLPERVDYYSKRLFLYPKDVRITSARSRWGSCSPDNRLCFSWRIMMVPLNVVDYVLLHELAHIKEKNHSKRFWDYLESVMPECRRHRSWLREHERELRL